MEGCRRFKLGKTIDRRARLFHGRGRLSKVRGSDQRREPPRVRVVSGSWQSGAVETTESGDRPPTEASDAASDVSYDCPRCDRAVVEPYYGPCDSCRAELRLTYAGISREVEAPEYEPKMNVTPNAVASKE